MRRICLNAEETLDNLVDEMTDAEYAKYDDFWDDIAPWRKGLNWSTRGLLLLLVVGVFQQNGFLITLAMLLFVPLFVAGAVLFFRIQNGSARIAMDILDRLDRT